MTQTEIRAYDPSDNGDELNFGERLELADGSRQEIQDAALARWDTLIQDYVQCKYAWPLYVFLSDWAREELTDRVKTWAKEFALRQDYKKLYYLVREASHCIFVEKGQFQVFGCALAFMCRKLRRRCPQRSLLTVTPDGPRAS